MSDIENTLNNTTKGLVVSSDQDSNSSSAKSESLKNKQELIQNKQTNDVGVDKMVDKKKKKDDIGGLTLLLKPTRRLPTLIEECIEKDFMVSLSKEGYYINGFYGLNENNQFKGFAFLQETDDPKVMVAFDNKNNKHVVSSFEDLVKFHSHIWGIYFKQSDDYKKPDGNWFEYLLRYGAVAITPGR